MASLRACKCGCGRMIEKDDLRWYYNHACRTRAYRNRRAIERRKRAAVKRESICAYCGQKFIPRQHNQRCCKPAHKQALYRELKRLGGHDYAV